MKRAVLALLAVLCAAPAHGQQGYPARTMRHDHEGAGDVTAGFRRSKSRELRLPELSGVLYCRTLEGNGGTERPGGAEAARVPARRNGGSREQRTDLLLR